MLKTQGLQTLEQVRAFLEGSQPLGFEVPARKAAYVWIAGELRRLQYPRLGKADKGLVRRYLEKVAGRSRAQITRLIKQFRETGRIRGRCGPPAYPSPGAIPRPISAGSPSSMPCTAPSRAPPPASSASVPTRCSAMPISPAA